jgi:hypothetical protein
VISRSFFFLTRKMKRNATRRCWHRRQNGSGELRAEHSKPPSTSQYNIVPSAIGIGGAVTCPPLPHHRTCGSAYGGSIRLG